MSKRFLDPTLIAKIKMIQIKAKSLVNSTFAGEYTSAFKGRGIEFEEVRDYLPGDDVRAIDWNVTARMGAPFLKTFRDERELTVLFAVDVSGSTQFGSGNQFKQELATEVAALLAYTALKSQDKVGLVIFSDHIEKYIPPKKGKGHIWQIIRTILSHEAKTTQTKFSPVCDFVSKILKKNSVVFLVSDFFVDQDPSWKHKIEVLSKRVDLTAIQVCDASEFELPSLGYIELTDIESGETRLVNTSSSLFQNSYHRKKHKVDQELKDLFTKSQIPLLQLKTDSPYHDELISYFRSRDNKRSMRRI